MKISREEVRRIAALASLEFDPAAEETMAVSMSRILEYVEQIRGAGEVNGEKPASSGSVPLREDDRADSLPVEEVSGAAPSFARGHFVVPRVIGGE